eukprot:9074721-Lingulodinium_polyedra.AAC.1
MARADAGLVEASAAHGRPCSRARWFVLLAPTAARVHTIAAWAQGLHEGGACSELTGRDRPAVQHDT